jgi:hypothetical protein
MKSRGVFNVLENVMIMLLKLVILAIMDKICAISMKIRLQSELLVRGLQHNFPSLE